MRIAATEQELLLQEVRMFGAVLRDPAARAPYERLQNELREGEIGDDLLGHLSNVLEIGLQSGRLRHLYGADGETALAGVFRRTPKGASLTAAAREVSEALNSLQGAALEDISVSALGPGSYGLTIDTDRCQISVRLDRNGVRIENVAIGV